MLQSICDLTTARPHTRKSAQFSPAEWRVYCEGYYTGVIFALRVAEEAIHRYQLATKTIRKMRKQQRQAG